MTFVGVDDFAQQIALGVVLVLAVAATIDRSKIPVVKQRACGAAARPVRGGSRGGPCPG